MEPRFFSILGLFPIREGNDSGLNLPQDHRDDEAWTLGVVPDSLVTAFRRSPARAETVDRRRSAREPSGNAVCAAS